MINIAICDDNHFFCENFINFFKSRYSDIIKNIDDFFNGDELIKYIDESGITYDFVFLDLDMPKMDGISTGNALRQLETHKNTIIMFITSFESNVVPVVDIHPFAYIKKPMDYSVFEQKFNAALDRFIDDDDFIILTSKRNTYKFTSRNILYMESFGTKSLVQFSDNTTVTVNIRLSDIHGMLSDTHRQFVRIHASYIVNLTHVTKTTKTYVFLNNGIELPLSKSYRDKFFDKFHERFHI